MKKIIELAEKYISDSDRLNGSSSLADVAEVSMDYDRLKEAITLRKALEQTPITEDWLKEHGFVVSDELHSKRDKIYVKNEIKVFLDVDCINGTVRNADCIEIIKGCLCFFHKDNYDNRHITTLAQLLDACELCGINLED